jgi:hypothetical protein
VEVASDPAIPAVAMSGAPGPTAPWQWRGLPRLLWADLELQPAGAAWQRSARDGVVDIAAVLIAAGLSTLGVWSRFVGHPFGLWRMVDVVVGAAACVSLGWRRRWPVHLAVALSIISIFSLTAGGAAAVATFGVAVRRPLRTVAWVALLGIIAGLINAAVFPDPTGAYSTSAIIIVLGTAVIVGWEGFVRARRQVVLSLAERARRAEADQQLR